MKSIICGKGDSPKLLEGGIYEEWKGIESEKIADKCDIAFLIAEDLRELDNLVYRLKTPIIVILTKVMPGYTQKVAKQTAKTIVFMTQIGEAIIVGSKFKGAANKALYWMKLLHGDKFKYFSTSDITAEISDYMVDMHSFVIKDLAKSMKDYCKEWDVDYGEVREFATFEISKKGTI